MSKFELLLDDFLETVKRHGADRDPKDINWMEVQCEIRSRWGGKRVYVPASEKRKDMTQGANVCEPGLDDHE